MSKPDNYLECPHFSIEGEPEDENCYYDDHDAIIAPIGFPCDVSMCPLLNSTRPEDKA